MISDFSVWFGGIGRLWFRASRSAKLTEMVDEPSYTWLEELNLEQRAAVMTHGDGPLLVVAGAGTGKTKTLAYRVAYLISQGVAPERILLLTFTRHAAQEMLRRASSIVARGTRATRAGLGWDVSFNRQPPAKTVSKGRRCAARFHGIGPRRHRRSDGCHPA